METICIKSTKICPICRMENEDIASICCGCGHYFSGDWYDLDSVTTISGENYNISSSATAFTPSFDELCNKFKNENDGISKEELLNYSEFLNNESLEMYSDLGFLKERNEGIFFLSLSGKDAYEINRTHKKKNLNPKENISGEC